MLVAKIDLNWDPPQIGKRPMSSARDMEQIPAAIEDATRVIGAKAAGRVSEERAVESLTAILDDGVVIRSLSRIRRRPVE